MTKRIYRPILVVLALSALAFQEPMLGILVGLTVANLLIKDHFPFSHFPMYTSLGKSTFYLYVANEEDEVLPVQHFRLSTTVLKKIYRTQIWEEQPGAKIEELPLEALQSAGDYTLAYLHQRPRRKKPPVTFTTLRLYQVNLSIEEDGEIRKATFLVTEG